MNYSQWITIHEEEFEEGGITFVQSVLQICSVKTNDTGVYSCIADIEGSNDTASFELIVVPPEGEWSLRMTFTTTCVIHIKTKF